MAPVLAAGGGLPGRRIAPTTAFVWLDDSYVTNGSRNVTALQDAAGFRVAGYTYGPFGQVLSMDGALAEVNPFRFSSEFHDDETGLVYYNYRYYSPSLGRWTKRAPIGEAGGLNSYVIVNNSIIDYWDNWGLVLYAFDGTGNYKNILGGYTNVYRLYTLYNAKRHYMRGVGTGGSFDQIHGGITGYGGKARLKAMLRALIQEYKNGNTVIDIIGFSRGAALAREFANMINEGSFFTGNYQHEWNRYGRLFTRRVFQKCPEVRFLGIFDTVASFGMPGNDVNVGYNMKIPDNVYFTAHAVALNEYRKCFPMSSIFGIAEPILGNKRKKEQGFPGAHSDIGGGYTTREQGAYLPLLWMWQEGNRVAREKGGDPNPMFGPLPKEITDFLDNVPENNRRFYLHDSRFGDNGEFQVQYYYDLSRTSRDIYFY